MNIHNRALQIFTAVLVIAGAWYLASAPKTQAPVQDTTTPTQYATWEKYTDTTHSFNFMHPADIAVSIAQGDEWLDIVQGDISFVIPNSYFVLPNTIQTSMHIHSQKSDFAGCISETYKTRDGNTFPVEYTFNGTKFYFEKSEDCGMSHCGTTKTYTTFNQGTCTLFSLVLYAGNTASMQDVRPDSEIAVLAENNKLHGEKMSTLLTDIVASSQFMNPNR